MMRRITPRFQYPKVLASLSREQEAARNDFMAHWLSILPTRYAMIERFNHVGAFRWPVPEGTRTLELGAGLGAHLEFEDLERQSYTANELRPEIAARLKERFPRAKVLVGDMQAGLDCPDNSFDRVVAIHVLEHLPELPRALREIDRLLVAGGVLQTVLPCEGGFAYWLARNISARRIFEKRYKMDYLPIIANEHVSEAVEIETELRKVFDLEQQVFFPLPFLPVRALNLVFGSLWRSRKKKES